MQAAVTAAALAIVLAAASSFPAGAGQETGRRDRDTVPAQDVTALKLGKTVLDNPAHGIVRSIVVSDPDSWKLIVVDPENPDGPIYVKAYRPNVCTDVTVLTATGKSDHRLCSKP